MTEAGAKRDGSAAILDVLYVRERSRGALAWTFTLLLHGAFVGFALGREPHVEPPPLLTEVSLLPPAPPPPPPPEPEPEPQPEPASAPRAAAPARPRANKAPAKPAAPASAAPLRTVDEAAPDSDEPVRFVTDPNGAGFGFGAVARGGTNTASEGATGPSTAPARAAPAAPLLSRPPRLADSDPCRGFFPERARVDRGEVTLRVRVERDGSVQWVSIVREHPTGHGFSFAARDCLRAKRFSPALDREGREVAVVSPVTVRFAR